VNRAEQVGTPAPRCTEVGSAVLRLGHHSNAAIGALQVAKKHKLRFHDEQMQAMRPVTALFAVRGNSGHGFRCLT
jgi:hypothetical protein